MEQLGTARFRSGPGLNERRFRVGPDFEWAASFQPDWRPFRDVPGLAERGLTVWNKGYKHGHSIKLILKQE